MATRWDERHEGTGYEETGWSSTTTGAAAMDEDFATSSVTGAPDNWDAQCLEVQTVLSETSYALEAASDEVIIFGRLEIIVNAEALANSENTMFMALLHDAANILIYGWIRKDSGGDLVMRAYINHDGTGSNVISDTDISPPFTLSLDTPYVFEWYWNVTDDEWNVWMDGREGTSHPGSITGTPETTPWQVTHWLEGSTSGESDAALTYYIDNYIMNDGAGERVGTGRFLHGLQPMGGGVGTKVLNPAHALGGRLNGGLQAA